MCERGRKKIIYLTPQKISESSSYYRNQVKQAGQIMEPFILRRLKSEVQYSPETPNIMLLCVVMVVEEGVMMG